MFGLTDQEMHIVVDVLVKLALGLVLAGAIGFEREIHGRPAGIRTHMLLIMGVILFSASGRYFMGGDTARVAAQVVVGVGFLGAGTIMRTGAEVKGLTTAASLWATAGIGMAIALGGAFMFIGVVATVLCLLTLSGIDILEYQFLHTKQTQVLRLVIDGKEQVFTLLAHVSAQTGVQVRSVNIVETSPQIVVDMELRGKTKGLLESVSAISGISSASWQIPWS